LKQNPYGKVPVLVDGAGVIYESAVINEYLDEKFPQVQLMPADLLQRAKVRIWIDFLNTRVHPAASDIAHNRAPEKAKEWMRKHLQALENEMGGKDYLVGNYSMADITFVPFYTRRERYGIVIDDTYPNLKRWGEALIARPQVAPTI
jgi:glutathione S-transferase